MALKDLLKKIPVLVSAILPKPILPQKRYLLIFLGLVYFAANEYVKMTPDPYDDEILRRIHVISMELLTNSSNLDEENYGERS